MSALNVAFDPYLPFLTIFLAVGVGVVVVLWGLLMRARGSFLRLAGVLLIGLALANPALVEEQREPLDDIALIVVDETPSQKLADRTTDTDEALANIMDQLDDIDSGLETRVLRLKHDNLADAAKGTTVLSPLREALADVPAKRLAGAIVITDGQIHDIPDGIDSSVFPAPIHSVMVGSRGEGDRRITILESPSFGLVGELVPLTARVDDPIGSGPVQISVSVDDTVIDTVSVLPGVNIDIEVPLDHRGSTVVELSVAPGPREITLTNNRAVVSINGVRDRLRVLLVSGEPYPGERTWRNLLKSDSSVDLVHFTILRPPEKQDGTPIHELSLIAFPTRELFEIKLSEFDLVVFDRFKRRGVLPSLYLNNIVEYVEGGGAYLEAVGPSFASPFSLYRTPLGRLMPGEPTGSVYLRRFQPDITEDGARHPVTSNLPGGPLRPGIDDPRWGSWFSQVAANATAGHTLMKGVDDLPLLILDRVEEGRVALMLSDHIWLWARGYDGGGPQAELLRRLAHWLMKEPELEEDSLTAELIDGNLVVTRRQVEAEPVSLTVTDPTGGIIELEAEDLGDGRNVGQTPVTAAGVYRVSDGTITTLAAIGDLNPLEFTDVTASDAAPNVLAEATGGGVYWAEDSIPKIRRTRPGRPASGPNWIGLKSNEDYVVTGISSVPLLPAPLLLAMMFVLLAVTWRREAD